MKNQTNLLLALSLALCGCATTGNIGKFVTPQATQGAAFMIGSNALLWVPANEQLTVAKYIYGIAHGLRTLTGGSIPTADQVKEMIAQFSSNADVGKWATLGTSIAALWGGVYPYFGGDTKLALQYLEALAAGLEACAAPYLQPKVVVTA